MTQFRAKYVNTKLNLHKIVYKKGLVQFRVMRDRFSAVRSNSDVIIDEEDSDGSFDTLFWRQSAPRNSL